MTSSYPAALDALPNPNSTTDRLGTAAVLHSSQHANANDAIEALQTKVGIDDSTVDTSLDYLVKVALPKGFLGQTALEAGQTGFGTGATDVSGLAVTVATTANRVLKVRVHLQAIVQGSAANFAVDVYEDATPIGRAGLVEADASGRGFVDGSVLVVDPSAGVHTYKAVVYGYAGAGTLDTEAAILGIPTLYIAVEDIGAA